MALKWIIVAACFAIFVLTIFAAGMFKPLGHDENMYCAAGALMAQGKLIYRDFSYTTHPPCHALVLAVIYKLLHTTYYLLVGRLVSIICDCLTALFIFLIYRRVLGNTQGVYLGLAAAAVHIFNPYVTYASGFAWNHDIVMLCVIASFWLCATKSDEQLPYWHVAVIAVLMTFAAFTRMTTALLWLLFLIFFLIERGQAAGRKFKAAGVFLLASLVVSLWPLYVIAQAPKAFWLDVYTISILNGRYLHSIGMAYDKIALARYVFSQPVYLITVVLSVGLWAAAFILRKSGKKILYRPLSLAVIIVFAFFAIALIVPTSWEQYFAMPVPFLIISIAYPLAELRRDIHRRLINLTAVVIVFLSIFLNPEPLAMCSSAFVPSSYVPMQIHAVAADIAAKAGKGGRILTLAPLFAIEGGCRIYPELAVGPFVYRVADSMTPEERGVAKAIGPLEIAEAARQNPPSAIILGTEPPQLEDPLLKIATPDWKKRTYFEGQLIVLFVPVGSEN